METKEERKRKVFAYTAADLQELPYRQASAITFILIVLIFGIPLWWYTTSTYRVPFSNFPQNQAIIIPVNLKIGCLGCSNTAILNVSSSLGEALMDLPRIEKLDLYYYMKFLSVRSEQDLPNLVTDDGKFNIYLLIVDNVKWKYPGKVTYFTSNSWTFIKKDDNKEVLLQRMLTAVADVLLDIGHLSTIIRRDLKKRMNPDEIEALPLNHQKRLVWDSAALSATYIVQVIFVHVDSEPQSKSEELESAVVNVRRFATKISEVTTLDVSTENLWDFSLSRWLEKDAAGRKMVKVHDISNIITKIDQQTSTVDSSAPLLKLVVFSSKEPIFLVDQGGNDNPGVVIASWGSLTFTGGKMTVSQSLIGALRVLLGLDTELPYMTQRHPSPVADWELNRLKLRSFVDCSMNAITSVQAIHNLVAQIDNIVINDEVAGTADKAVHLVKSALDIVQTTGRIEVAMTVEGRALADQAVNDQSLLALLYFPNDQKFAVYLPLFLPTLLPIFGSIVAFYKYWKGKE